MPKKDSYYELLKSCFNNLIETLELKEERQKQLEQALWMEGQVARLCERYYLLRLTTLIGRD